MTIKERKESPLFTSSLIPHGNGKLLDYTDDDGNAFRYAQFNTRAIKDCPFRSAGCEAVCYATKGNHLFPSVIESRERSYLETRRADFAESIIFTIQTHKGTKRYKDSTMILRLHESGDFYSVQYLRAWVRIWAALENVAGFQTVFYTKSFPFFLMLNPEEKATINRLMEEGKLSMNLSIDDTTSPEQWRAYFQMKKEYPLANTYRVTERVKETETKCDCADCARCGRCNKATGSETAVEIHSASNADVETYRKNATK